METTVFFVTKVFVAGSSSSQSVHVIQKFLHFDRSTSSNGAKPGNLSVTQEYTLILHGMRCLCVWVSQASLNAKLG